MADETHPFETGEIDAALIHFIADRLQFLADNNFFVHVDYDYIKVAPPSEKLTLFTKVRQVLFSSVDESSKIDEISSILRFDAPGSM